MKKSKIIILIATIILVALTVVAVAAAALSETTLGIIDAIINDEEYDVVNDLNGDGEIDIRDVILGVKKDNFGGPGLTSLELDGGYKVVEEVKYDTFNYTVQLPAGRPRIPRITAKTDASDATIAYQNATIADDELFGYAKVIISDDSGENVYTVKFVRAEVEEKNATIALQYDDRWTFTPNSNATGIKFTSSNPETASVNEETGEITALAVTNGATTPVTIFANVGETVVDKLTISRIDKAVVNLFFVTGQSNAQGCYDFVDTDGDGTKEDSEKFAQSDEQLKDVIQPDKAGQVYIYDARPFWNSENTLAGTAAYILPTGMDRFYDLHNVKRAGFASALGKTYYDLSGEKVVFLHAAYNGSPIEQWLDPELYPDLAEDYAYDKEKIENVNHYVNAQKRYRELMDILDSSKYEINHRANFWLQGESCMSYNWDYNINNWNQSPSEYEKLFSAEDYTDMFMKFHEQMKSDFQIETNNILLVRAHGSIVKNADGNIKAALNNVRSSQYGMANTNSEITIVSRLSDWVVPYNAKYNGTPYEAYNGLMGVGNVHYNQTGHNENGIIAATNYFKKLDVDTTSVATSVEIIDTDGIKRFAANEVIGEFEVGTTKRIAAFALPEYSLENVAYASSNEKVATINENGLITIVGVGEATITATAESGVSASVVVKGKARTTAPTKYTLKEGDTKTIAKYLPEFRFADITYTSDNEKVATVSDKGVITALGGGAANIKATSKTGAYVEFVVTGIAKQVVKESIHYRWDFNGNLKSSADENDLRLSDLTKDFAAENYEYVADENSYTTDGKLIYVDGSLADSEKPDFTMAYPVTVSSETDWAIEWRAMFTNNSVIIGRENCYDSSSGKYLSHIYSIYKHSSGTKEDFDYTKWPLRFNNNNRDEYFLTYSSQTYANMNTSMNTWKLDYKKYTGKMTLSVLVNGAWTAIDTIEPGEFTATYNTVLGRYNADGIVNFEGYMDYLDIKVSPAEVLYDTHYRWDFEAGKEYDSTYDKNTLTKTDDAHTISNGDYVTSGKAGELKMENAVVLDDKHDWMIETEFSTYENNVMLIGLENCKIDGKYESHIYFSSTGYKGVQIEPDPNAGSGITVPFDDSTKVNKEMKKMNKWRIGYEVATDTLTVYMYNTTTGDWDKAGKLESAPSFTVTSDCLFGDYAGTNSFNMNGTVKYFDVIVEDSKAVGAKEYVYEWDFNNWESRGLQNTLTPGATSGTLSGGKYTTTTRGDELALQVPITLDSTKDWSIEWSAAASSTKYTDYSLIATDKSAGKYNHIYFSPNAYNAIVFKSAAGSEFAKLPFATEKATTKTLSAASNTWKIEYKKDINELSIQRWDSTNGQWIEKSYVNPLAFSMEFSHLFGDFGKSGIANWVNFYGSADYMTIRYTVSQ